MFSADALRTKTEQHIVKPHTLSWRKVKKRIKEQAKKEKYICKFQLNELSDKNVNILRNLGFYVVIERLYPANVKSYRISWQYPLEYWNNDTFTQD